MVADRSLTSLPPVGSSRPMGMHRFRQLALALVFSGWMLPAFLAQSARERVPKNVPDTRTPMELLTGVAPPPPPADRVVTMFRVVASAWFIVALIYAVVLTIRLRRTLVR
jgi:hypothetical protein